MTMSKLELGKRKFRLFWIAERECNKDEMKKELFSLNSTGVIVDSESDPTIFLGNTSPSGNYTWGIQSLKLF